MKEINWEKPIETDNGNFAQFIKQDGDDYLCAVHQNDNTSLKLFISEFKADGSHKEGSGHIRIRNKPELIKLEHLTKYIVIWKNGDFTSTDDYKNFTGESIIAKCTTVEFIEFMKKNGGIPKGYGLGDKS